MVAGDARYKVAIIAPTCFYYQAPLYRALAAHPRIDLMVYFCSDEALNGLDITSKFKTDGQWGVEDRVVSGYNYKFLKNYSPSPSYLKWPLGLLNFGIWGEIRRRRPHIVVVMSWMNPTWWMAILACLRYKIPFLYLTDQNVKIEPSKPKWLYHTKQLLLGRGLFRLASGFLCAGTANMKLYGYYGVPDSKLVPFAYSWGYASLFEVSSQLRARRNQIRSALGIPTSSYVFLYCGRLSPEKNLLHLLEAYQRLGSPGNVLAIVGDGQLKGQMQDYVANHRLESVRFFGFQDRNAVLKFYAMADALVLPSLRETWGMVVNEAMCFALPVIVSDQVGAGMDLVFHGYNGYKCREGDLEGLTANMVRLCEASEVEQSQMGNRSLEIIKRWSQRDLAAVLVKYSDELYSVKGRQRSKIPG